jgi:hypothetical protein
MEERNAMPEIYTEKQLHALQNWQLVALLAEAVKEYTNGMAFNGLLRTGYFSREKIERWEKISIQLQTETLRRLNG